MFLAGSADTLLQGSENMNGTESNHVLKFHEGVIRKKKKRPYMGKCPEWDNDEKKL